MRVRFRQSRSVATPLVLAAAWLSTMGLVTSVHAQGQPPPQPFTSFMQDLRDREYAPIRSNVVKTLALLDDQKLAFKPVPAVRTLGEEIEHIALVNLRLCGLASMGLEPSPAAGPRPTADSTRPRRVSELSAFVTRSLELCDRALARIDDVTAKARTTGPYMRYSHLQAMVTHMGHEYGKLTVSLRLLGLVPPSTTS